MGYVLFVLGIVYGFDGDLVDIVNCYKGGCSCENEEDVVVYVLCF